MKLWIIGMAILVPLSIIGCAAVDRYDEVREDVLDAATERWCGLTDEEKVALAERRDYSDEFVVYLESRCDSR